MIGRAEILGRANDLGLEARVVEKDYVLGWLLAGIARDEELSRAWLFKGGTCLKKCFFETYRFTDERIGWTFDGRKRFFCHRASGFAARTRLRN
jgi:predicted nucleotidyltransferase component of viral defense system